MIFSRGIKDPFSTWNILSSFPNLFQCYVVPSFHTTIPFLHKSSRCSQHSGINIKPFELSWTIKSQEIVVERGEAQDPARRSSVLKTFVPRSPVHRKIQMPQTPESKGLMGAIGVWIS